MAPDQRLAGLSTREREVLDLESIWWQVAPTKRQAIAERLGCSQAAYYATLRRLAASPEAFRYSPLVIQRLRSRIRKARRQRLLGSAETASWRPPGQVDPPRR
jgi:hypothetical protein